MKKRFFLKQSILLGVSLVSVTLLDKRSQAKQNFFNLFDSSVSTDSINTQLIAQKPKLTFPPVPEEDAENGRNSNAHLAGTPESTAGEKQAFIQEITQYAQPLEKEHGVPACVVIAIAVFLSGFGRNRVAYYANNLFRIRYVNRRKGCRDGSCDNVKTYQLKGQPNELANTAIMINKKYGDNDRFVFDEESRSGNRYRVFDSYQEGVNFLVKEVFLKNADYKTALDKYKNNLSVLGANKAGKQLAFELAEAGFVFMQPQDFQAGVGKVMDEWKLCP